MDFNGSPASAWQPCIACFHGNLKSYTIVLLFCSYVEANIPRHPCLRLVANSEQPLSRTVGRRLITMEKTSHPQVRILLRAKRGLYRALSWVQFVPNQYQLSHQCVTGAPKRVTNKELKALFNWKIFAKHDQMSLSDISLESFLIQIVFKNQ